MSDVASNRSDITYPSSFNRDGVDYPDKDDFLEFNGYEKMPSLDGESKSIAESDDKNDDDKDDDRGTITSNMHIHIPASIYRLYIWVKDNINQNPEMGIETDSYILSLAEKMNKCMLNKTNLDNVCPIVKYLIDRYNMVHKN